ncbi:2'-5' RNA ligase family protein [Streptomyces sp. LP11]|uniref:2'-5' RNA ligase family protein n=1 Tax=Streptomyces pyxinicus TaxID=2970331 RepID=A0ABT2B2C8_9ACTN|nr:2'-5' RNA ligase family protein [Streptomyces sp. LP11]MCS0602667.1 2'-5' RNA ligase family protein [Streptomyces sp. LP11]
MQGVGFVGEVEEHDVRAIADAAGERLAAVPAFGVQVGPHVRDPGTILLHVHPDGSVHAVRTAFRSVLDEVPENADGFTPHVSVAYGASSGPAGPVFQARDQQDFTPAQARGLDFESAPARSVLGCRGRESVARWKKASGTR